MLLCNEHAGSLQDFLEIKGSLGVTPLSNFVIITISARKGGGYTEAGQGVVGSGREKDEENSPFSARCTSQCIFS